MNLTVSGEGLQEQSISITTENQASDDKYLESYDIVKNYYVNVGETPTLPKTVNGRFSDELLLHSILFGITMMRTN